MRGKLTFMGTGASVGVPVIGCNCLTCLSNNPLNSRLRPSALLEIKEKKFLIDAGPDFRQQALRYKIDHLDAVFLTHAHHDHTAGLDDLRALCFLRKGPLPLVLSKATAAEVLKRFDYLFIPNPYLAAAHPKFNLHTFCNQENQLNFAGLEIKYVCYEQGGMKVNGFRVGNLAYVTDIKEFTDQVFPPLMQVDTLVISALRETSSYMHLSVEEAIAFAKRIHAKKVWLTHLSHDLEHEQIEKKLPPHVRLAYDGLTIDFG